MGSELELSVNNWNGNVSAACEHVIWCGCGGGGPEAVKQSIYFYFLISHHAVLF